MRSDDAAQFLENFDVSRETISRLEAYEALLTKWNPRINLVSATTLSQIWSRHFLDSAQIFDLAANGNSWADLGSGGGFPGLIIAALAAEKKPDLRVTLVESDLRKSAFLASAAREMKLSVHILSERIEQIPALTADVLSARALAPLEKLLEFSHLHLRADGVGIFPKGESWRKEVTAAQKVWSFDYEAYDSKTDSEAAILVIKGVKRV
jgi:16S rRNA (guanine527-N7)-methyltransferase